MPPTRGLTLFVDADDTLWENNIYFEAVVADYLALAQPARLPARAGPRPADRGRAGAGRPLRLRHLELPGQPRAGLPQRSSSRRCASTRPRFATLCASLRRRAGTHLAEVATTLRALAGRHRVVLLTKGDGDDQMGKVARSGLRRHLHQVDVVPEKDERAYRDVLRRHGADPARTWMVGNSPKSDILPALAAGLGAVFVPHPATWTLELAGAAASAHAPLRRRCERFRDLLGPVLA